MNNFVLFFEDGGTSGGGIFSTVVLFAPILLIFYFLLIRPQQKQQKELKALVAELKTGDEVVTNGGIIGKIIESRDMSFIIRSADKSNLEVARTAVVGKKPENK
jgi:preprotein translocase subunit YajC